MALPLRTYRLVREKDLIQIKHGKGIQRVKDKMGTEVRSPSL